VLYVGGCLGHRQRNDRSSMDVVLDRQLDECPRTKKALLLMPHWSMNEVGKDIGGATEGLHLHE
jgi:hypothetical protein